MCHVQKENLKIFNFDIIPEIAIRMIQKPLIRWIFTTGYVLNETSISGK